MKIGIASDDGKVICPHFGRTLGFVIVEIEDGKEKSREFRENTFTGHAMNRAAGGNGHHGESDRRPGILGALGDCEAIIANGMGMKIYNALGSAGIKAIITNETGVDKAIELYIAGELDDNPDRGCSHKHQND